MRNIAERFIAAFLLVLLFAAPAYAQWQVPNHAVPIGLGAGTGFGSVPAGSAGQLFIGQGATTNPAFETLSGSCTLTSAGVISCTGGAPSGSAGGDLSGTYPNPGVAKVNGVTYPSAPSANTVPVVTSATFGGTTTYEALPNAALANSGTTPNGVLCTLGSTCTITVPIATGVTGLGTGVATALAVNVGTAGSPVVNGGALGTPSSGVGTNLTGTAAGLTAGHVTTNANLTGPITSVGNATSIAAQTGTGTTFVMSASPSIASLTVTGAFTATGLVTNADLANTATTVNGQTCTLGSTCTVTTAASSIAVGTTTITSGTNGNIEFNNSGVLGEKAVTGTGSVALSDSPIFTTQATDPVLIGGNGTGSSLEMRSTSGVGATDFIKFTVGNNGATEAMRVIDAGRVGIGTIAPPSPLTVSQNTTTPPAALGGSVLQVTGADAANMRLQLNAFGGTNVISFIRADSTNASPTAVQANEQIGVFGWLGYGATTYANGSRAFIAGLAAENWTDTAQGTYFAFYTNPNGTAVSGTERMRIADSGLIGLGTSTLTGLVSIGAGTATVAPLSIIAGTNLTTAVAGTVEYDGKAFYASAAASSRQVIDAEQVTILSADNTAPTNVATAQNVFPTGQGTLTVQAATTYEFEAGYEIDTTGATSNSLQTLFGGTATFTSIGYIANATNSTTSTVPSAASMRYATAATAVNVTAATAAATQRQVVLRGVMRINAGGTVIPQFQYSSAPGAAPVVRANSFFRCWPVGSNTVTQVGNWS